MEILRGLLSNAIYGGKIDVSQDYTKLTLILSKFFSKGAISFRIISSFADYLIDVLNLNGKPAISHLAKNLGEFFPSVMLQYYVGNINPIRRAAYFRFKGSVHEDDHNSSGGWRHFIAHAASQY